LGLTATAGLLVGNPKADGVEDKKSESAAAAGKDAGKTDPSKAREAAWIYHALDPKTVAADAYKLYPDGSCMYAVFGAVIAALAKIQPEPFGSFPCHMMKYGAGGIGHWGSTCGAINGGAAIIGLFERDKQRREDLIAELFSWYEKTELPEYRPQDTDESASCVKIEAQSVLCHASVSRWCRESGCGIESAARKERCRRLTADVAIKTVELLNANLKEPCKFAGLNPEVKSCLACHNEQRHDTSAKMQCGACHPQLSKAHPAVSNATSTSLGKAKDGEK
jgi:hypothetical protein